MNLLRVVIIIFKYLSTLLFSNLYDWTSLSIGVNFSSVHWNKMEVFLREQIISLHFMMFHDYKGNFVD